MSNSSSERSDITATQIYEILQSRAFLEDLWWDLIADLKNKETYISMKELIEKLISKQVTELPVFNSDEDKMKRRRVVTEICSMAYTMDTVFSKILYKMLQSRTNIVVENLYEDVTKNPVSIPSKNSTSPSKVSTDDNIKNSVGTSGTPKSKDVSLLVNSTKKNTAKSSTPKLSESSDKISETSKSKVLYSKSRDEVTTKRSVSPSRSEDGSSSKKSETKKISKSERNRKDSVHSKKSDQDSDSDSDISDEELSVSSVHTSDLSSYEDTLSLSDEDEETGAKRLPIKKIQEMLLNGKFKNKLPLKKISRPGRPRRRKSSRDEDSPSDEFVPSERISITPSHKTLPPRIRRPNSKYSSETVLCPMKKLQFTKDREDVSPNYDYDIPKRKSSLGDSDSSNFVFQNKKYKNDDPKQNTLSEVPKLRPSIAFNTRKSTAVTLFSTSILKK